METFEQSCIANASGADAVLSSAAITRKNAKSLFTILEYHRHLKCAIECFVSLATATIVNMSPEWDSLPRKPIYTLKVSCVDPRSSI